MEEQGDGLPEKPETKLQEIPLFDPDIFSGDLPPVSATAGGEHAGKLVDQYGRAFDPAIHMTEKDGSPVIIRKAGKNKGKLRMRPGRKPVPQTARPVQSPLCLSQEVAESTPSGQETLGVPCASYLPEYLITYIEAAAVGVFGDAWRMTEDERMRLSDSAVALGQKYGADVELSPEAEFGLACADYFGKRVAVAEERGKLAKLWGRVASFFRGRGGLDGDKAFANRGVVGDGEVDTSKGDGTSVQEGENQYFGL